MATDRSDLAYGYWREAAEKFDYYVTGLTGALAAYVGQTMHPFRIGLNSQTVEFIALASLVGSVFLGIKRLEATVTLHKLSHSHLYSKEARGALMSASQTAYALNKATGDVISAQHALTEAEKHAVIARGIQEKIHETTEAAKSLYLWRNRLLFAGFAVLVLARVLPAYVP